MTGLGYDVQGNLSNKNGTQYAFDYGNRLRAATYAGNPLEAYQYDGHGRRVLATSAAGAIASFYSQGGQLLYQDNGRDGQTHSYFYLAGSLVNELTRNPSTGAAANRFQHTDALGSPVAVTNGSRTVLERREYEPYGLQLAPAPADGPGYTGHVYDAATGLNYMQQRYYDPGIPRFLSVDPVTAYSDPIGAFNRYRYAANNPYKFTDPDGRQQAPVTFIMPQGFPVNVADIPAYEKSKTSPGMTQEQFARGADTVSTFATTVALATSADAPPVAVFAEFASMSAAVVALLAEPTADRALNVATGGIFRAANMLSKGEEVVEASVRAVEVVENMDEVRSTAIEIEERQERQTDDQ